MLMSPDVDCLGSAWAGTDSLWCGGHLSRWVQYPSVEPKSLRLAVHFLVIVDSLGPEDKKNRMLTWNNRPYWVIQTSGLE